MNGFIARKNYPRISHDTDKQSDVDATQFLQLPYPATVGLMTIHIYIYSIALGCVSRTRCCGGVSGILDQDTVDSNCRCSF